MYGATIYFSDEAFVHSDYHVGTSCVPIEQPPIIGATGSRFLVNRASAISPCGEIRWIQVEGPMMAGRFIDFLATLIKHRMKLVVMITDDHFSHWTKVVVEFAKANRHRLELHLLPPYSPG